METVTPGPSGGAPPRSFRSQRTPPGAGLFLQMDRAKQSARAAGRDIIDLSVGNSDLAPPPEALAALREAVEDPQTYGYCLKSQTLPLVQAAVAWYHKRYGVLLDVHTEALSLIGTQEGLAHLLLAVTDPGDVILMTTPAYPSYFGAIQIAGLTPHYLPLGPDFLPDFAAPSLQNMPPAKVMLLNYPNNPTSAVADEAFFQRALSFAEQHDLLLIHDNPYADQLYAQPFAPSPLALPGARARVVELFSFAKSYNIAGFRLGYALGCAEALAALEAVKAPIDFNQYLGIQRMGVVCLNLPDEVTRRTAKVWERRAAALVAALNNIGWKVDMPTAGMYIWAKLPEGWDDLSFCMGLVAKTGVALAPGQGFGSGGKGYVRFALVRAEEVMVQAVRKIAQTFPGLVPADG